MSEEKKASEKILERMEKMEATLKTLIESNKPQPTVAPSEVSPSSEKNEAEAKAHTSLEEQLNCPDCYPLIRDKVIEKEFKDADFECEKCGLPTKKEESGKPEWKCLGCGHAYAKPKR